MSLTPVKSPPKAPNPFVIRDLGQVDPRDFAAVAPVRWADYPLDERPYSTIEEEYIRSPYPLGVAMLRERWAGIYDEASLLVWNETSRLKAMRFEFQDKALRETMQQSYAGDAEFVALMLNREIVELNHLIEHLNAQLDCGYEYARVKGSGAGPLGYVRQPLTVDSRTKLINSRVKLSERLGQLLGLASEITQVNVKIEGTYESRLVAFMADNDEEYAALKNVIEGGSLSSSSAKEAPQLTGTSGDNQAARVRLEAARGRVIDSVPLPMAGEPVGDTNV